MMYYSSIAALCVIAAWSVYQVIYGAIRGKVRRFGRDATSDWRWIPFSRYPESGYCMRATEPGWFWYHIAVYALQGSLALVLPVFVLFNIPLHAIAILLFVIFLVLVAVDSWAAIVVIFQHRLDGWPRSSYFIITLLAVVAAFVVTSFFSYYSNPNTHVFGWPVPRVIFQRDTPASPWLDYVGPTVLLAYPMNFVVYMSIPSIAFIVLALRRRRQNHETVAQ